MEVMAFSIGGIFAITMLIFGIILTVITILRIRSGKITLPTWGKFLVCAAMIGMLAIQIACMLPPKIVNVDNPFVEEHTHIVVPSAPETTEAAH